MIETLRLAWTAPTSIGEAWFCETSRRLAAFVVSSMRGQGALSGGRIGGNAEPLEAGERR
jgi:hypothetical protein